jgi:hypothetical protein
MPKDIFDEVNDKGSDDHWRNKPKEDGPMFSKWRDKGDEEMPKGKLEKGQRDG